MPLRNSIRICVGAAMILSCVVLVGCGEDDNPGGGGSPRGTPGTPLVYGGQTYRTVIIGGKTWMAENLNYQTADSWCYDNNPSNCNTYGRLYTWDAAMTACPAGWHLSTGAEWEALVSIAGGTGTKLKSRSGWCEGRRNCDDNGTDDFGFSALPGGQGHMGSGFLYGGLTGNWWSATEETLTGLQSRWELYGSGNMFNTGWPRGNTYSVRCVMN